VQEDVQCTGSGKEISEEPHIAAGWGMGRSGCSDGNPGCSPEENRAECRCTAELKQTLIGAEGSAQKKKKKK
jgi:hypothetical protein